MPTSTAVDTTVEGFPTPSIPKHYGKPDYTVIKETHQLLMANADSIECELSGDQKGYLGLILPSKQYARVYRTAFVLLPGPGRTTHAPAWTAPTEETRVLHEHTEQRRM